MVFVNGWGSCYGDIREEEEQAIPTIKWKKKKKKLRENFGDRKLNTFFFTFKLFIYHEI